VPELPEVEAITAVAARHSVGQVIESVEVIREPANNPYFGAHGMLPTGRTVRRVYRRGKRVLFELDGSLLIDCHNAMTGYWDYSDDPWTFDYVEGPRTPGAHVRVRMLLSNGRVLRFNDARLFGRLRLIPLDMAPSLGPELMTTPHCAPGAPVMTLERFARWMLSDPRPVKAALMDQDCLAGIGNIYSSEACHLAGIDPRLPARQVYPGLVPVLYEALRCAVLHSLPKVTYSWLNVYRRSLCGSCGGPVTRSLIDDRATFLCESCQRP
jgi:formamidopyrimidine-DNA glycosylase